MEDGTSASCRKRLTSAPARLLSGAAGRDRCGSLPLPTFHGGANRIDRKLPILERLKVLRREIGGGGADAPKRLTVGEYLERWLEASARPSVRPTTLASYRSTVKEHIAPRIGGAKLLKLGALDLQRLYSALGIVALGGLLRSRRRGIELDLLWHRRWLRRRVDRWGRAHWNLERRPPRRKCRPGTGYGASVGNRPACPESKRRLGGNYLANFSPLPVHLSRPWRSEGAALRCRSVIVRNRFGGPIRSSAHPFEPRAPWDA